MRETQGGWLLFRTELECSLLASTGRWLLLGQLPWSIHCWQVSLAGRLFSRRLDNWLTLCPCTAFSGTGYAMLTVIGRVAKYLKLPCFQMETDSYSLHQGEHQAPWLCTFASLFCSCVMEEQTGDAYVMCFASHIGTVSSDIKNQEHFVQRVFKSCAGGKSPDCSNSLNSIASCASCVWLSVNNHINHILPVLMIPLGCILQRCVSNAERGTNHVQVRSFNSASPGGAFSLVLVP